MQCVSCEKQIDPSWTHAIEMNICPMCGKNIMDENLNILFSSLRETMEGFVDYQEQLDDWMLSNHNYIKTNSSNLHLYMPKGSFSKNYEDDEDFQKRKNKKFTVKVENENGEEEEIESETIQSEAKTNSFFKRAEAIKPTIEGYNSVEEKTQRIKKMAQQIRREGSNISSHGNSISQEALDYADEDARADYQSMIEGGEVMSALPDNNDDDIPSVVLNMARKASNKEVDSNNDLDKLRQQQAKIANSRKNLHNGGGSFSRS